MIFTKLTNAFCFCDYSIAPKKKHKLHEFGSIVLLLDSYCLPFHNGILYMYVHLSKGMIQNFCHIKTSVGIAVNLLINLFSVSNSR